MNTPDDVGTEPSVDTTIPKSSQKLSGSPVTAPGPTLPRISLYNALGWRPQDLEYAYDFQQQHAELDCCMTGTLLSAGLYETFGRDNTQQDCRDIVRSLRHQQKKSTVFWSNAESTYLKGFADRVRGQDAKALGFRLANALKEEYGTNRTPRSCQHKVMIYRASGTLSDNMITADSDMRKAQPYKKEFGLIALQSIVRQPTEDEAATA